MTTLTNSRHFFVSEFTTSALCGCIS